MFQKSTLRGFLAVAWVALPCLVDAAPSPLDNRQATPTSKWVDTWAAMPQLVEPSNLPPTPFLTSSSVFNDATLRQTLHVSIAASQIRVLISNIFGTTALPITAGSIALPTGGTAGASGIDTTTLMGLTFNGSASVSIPAGQAVYTDPLNFAVKDQTMVTVSLYLQTGQSGNSITGHPGSRTTSWMQAGNQVNASTMGSASTEHWYFVTDIEAWSPSSYSAWVVLGDSLTDGRESTENGNNRWPDLVLARLQSAGMTTIGLANEAAGGNSVLSGGLGPPLLTRYKRDAIQQEGVKYVRIFEGVNDIGGGGSNVGSGLIAAFEQIASDCHTAGLKVFGATITPFGTSSYASSKNEQTRQQVNAWILNATASGVYDEVVDFASVVADPTTPSNMASQYNSGDGLHPNVAGYTALANAVPLSWFS